MLFRSYFAGEYEHAINLWTRVLFLDRNHDRARAYIERARSAQAEQQRISEVLIHEGLEAFDRGEVVRARTLLSDALDQGASNDVALGVLGRIDRLDVGSRVPLPAQPDVRRKAAPRTAAVPDANQRRSTLTLWWVTTAAIVLISLMAFVLNSPGVLAEWFPEQAAASPAAPTPAPLTPLPVPSPTESYLAQARTLFSSGKLRAFQCLVYLHRYNEGTLARMRTEYVIPLQGRMAGRIQQLEEDKTKASTSQGKQIGRAHV